MSGVGETLSNLTYLQNVGHSRGEPKQADTGIISADLRGEEAGDRSQDIKVKDWEITISQAEKRPSITYLINFTDMERNSWMRIWDDALDRGPVGTILELLLCLNCSLLLCTVIEDVFFPDVTCGKHRHYYRPFSP